MNIIEYRSKFKKYYNLHYSDVDIEKWQDLRNKGFVLSEISKMCNVSEQTLIKYTSRPTPKKKEDVINEIIEEVENILYDIDISRCSTIKARQYIIKELRDASFKVGARQLDNIIKDLGYITKRVRIDNKQFTSYIRG